MKKNIFKYIIAGASLFLVSSCGEEFLEIEHNDILPSTFMFENQTNIFASLNGIYDTFYPDKEGAGDAVVWGFKPQMFIA
ncbi:MAG: RagB/SusD family nutrient uptake outer membrane protein, partial [Mediterranea sp.]|nr:RagB/SusD family nutrient uptake outer membrane protein [Mediterranea sp.]